MKVLFVTTEVRPFSRSGGLGDVAGSLPRALKAQGVDARIVFPKYGNIQNHHLKGMRYLDSMTVHLSWRAQGASIYTLEPQEDENYPQIYLIENDYYFGRDGLYGYGDDYERFAFFSKASIEFLTKVDFRPDIIHFNEWQTGLGCTYLRDMYRGFTFYENMKSLFSIHNLNYQGIFGRDTLWSVGLNDGYYTNGDLEFYENISLLKAGIVHSDAVSTVSETYSHEIQTPSYGYGMDGLLRKKGEHEGNLYGIVNGIDMEQNNPATDQRIFVNYDASNVMEKKRENKYKLQEQLGLPRSDAPMIGIISRLASQKGFDIISLALDEILSKDVQLVILGTGEGRYEELFRNYAWRYPDKLSTQIVFSDELAQCIYAASDIFLMPSIYEPCGLGQMYAMRYGTLPVVRKTGGLADTVQHYENGFVFEDFVASGMMWALNQALECYYTPKWQELVSNAMACDFSWDKSAATYIELYNKLKGDPSSLEEAKERISSGQATCVLMMDGLIIGEASGIGVKPILQFLEKDDLKDVEVADKVIGKAAAMLLVKGGVSYVYGQIMSSGARDYLKTRGIATTYGKLVDSINDRTGKGMCPLEEAVLDIDNPDDGYKAIKKTIAVLMSRK